MPQRPNILIMCADQLRADAVGCYGNEVCRTPNLDNLAGGGVLMENCYTPNPICVPARASMATGNYSHRATGCKDNEGLIRDGQTKLAQHFADAGYQTYACGKLHYVPYAAPGRPRLVHGFQHWDAAESGRILAQYDPAGRQSGLEDYHDYLADVGWGGYSRAHGIGNNDVRPCDSPLPAEHHVDHWVADRTIARLNEHAARGDGKPFLMWCSFPKPHSPYDPPRGYAQMYDPRTIPAPLGDPSMLEDRDPQLMWEYYARAQSSLSPQARRVIKCYYYGLISFQDEQVGRVLAELDALNLADDTIVVYLADHGDMMGDFGAFFKCTWHEGSAHVPMIWRVPGGPAGERRPQLVGLHDILPTLAALTDCPLPDAVDGFDLNPVFAGQAVRDVFYGQCRDAPDQTGMVFDGRWKYCYAEQGAVEELYDLETDPHELTNLAGEADESLLTEWRGRLMDEARRWGDTDLLDGGRLATAPLDRDAMRRLPVQAMGWRYY